jgi:hypothetical protein
MALRVIRVMRVAGPRGFTNWVQPVRRGYMMACCDCGLVHEMSFRVVNGRVQFRARRAPKYTARERRRRH